MVIQDSRRARLDTVVDAATAACRVGVMAVAEVVGVRRGRRTWSGHDRAWIEVRGLDSAGGDRLAADLLRAVRRAPGVGRAEVNRPLSRLIIELTPGTTTVSELVRGVEYVERRHATRAAAGNPASATSRARAAEGGPGIDLPGDRALLISRVVALGADAAGLAAAVTGRALRWPALPAVAAAAVTLVDHQPRARRVMERQLGADATDVVLAVATAATHAASQAPAALGVDLLLRAVAMHEVMAGRRAWDRLEPELAAYAGSCIAPRRQREVPVPNGPGETYADAAAAAGLLAAATLGVRTGSGAVAANALQVAAPKAVRTARESFAGTLSAGLHDRFGALVLRSAALRMLDRVDTLLIDPAVLSGDTLSVLQIEGLLEGDQRTRVWQAATGDVEDGLLLAGQYDLTAISPAHKLTDLPSGVELVIGPVRDPLADAVIAAARDGGLRLLSLDRPELGSLRSAFDDLLADDQPAEADNTALAGGARSSGPDAVLAAAVRREQRAGRCVAVLGGDVPASFAAADLALAVTTAAATPAWSADVLVPDLAAAWRVLQAAAAARTATRRGIELSIGGSILGALLMLPGVRGRGPGPVVAGAAFGLLDGRAGARRVLRRAGPRPVPAEAWHAMSVEQVRAALCQPCDVASWDGAHAAIRQRDHLERTVATRAFAAGQRTLGHLEELVGAVRLELADPLTPVLAIGAGASAVLGSPVDAALVGCVVAGNAVLSAAQRLRSEHRLNRLLNAEQPTARLVGGGCPSVDSDPAQGGAGERGQYRMIDPQILGAGDLIELRSGEVVPADLRLVSVDAVEVDESSLTGESFPVSKAVTATPAAPLAERACMLYQGTTLVTGTAVGIVTAVGSGTAAGRADVLAPRRHGEVGLQAQLARLTARVVPVTLAAGAAVTGTALLRGSGLHQAVTSGVSIAVAAVPEGLPLVATLAQQASARRLVRHDVLVRVPRSVEALGRVDVVCFDKTGTLSENRLQVTAVTPAPGTDAQMLMQCAALATPRTPPGHNAPHATDAAVLAAVAELASRDFELRFRAGRSFAAGLAGAHLAVKGSPEVVLAACTDPDPGSPAHAELVARAHTMAAHGLRILAVADRRLTGAQAAHAAQERNLEISSMQGLTFRGFLGLADTIRPDAGTLLTGLAERDIGIRLITGDHPLTARAIAAELGLPTAADQIMTGPQWETLSHRARADAVERVRVFARMNPEHKVQVVEQLTAAGHVVAMVGDGANDAAAIRAAAVGIGVSTHGSDPARGAADIVLTGGRIASLLAAVDEGDQLWHRVQAAVGVLLGGNAGEIAFTLIGTAIGGRAPLNARQLLLVNLLTDALPAAAVAVSPTASTPSTRARGLDQAALMRTVAIRGTATTAGATVAWSLASLTGRPRRASTVGLVALVSTQLGQTLLDSHSPLVLATAAGSLGVLAGLISTPGLSQLLGCTPLGPLGWAQALGSATAATLSAAAAPAALHWIAQRGSRTDLRDTGAQQQPAHAAHERQQHHRAQLDQNLHLHLVPH